MSFLRTVARTLANNYREVKAELKQEAISKGRMLKGLADILGLEAFKKQRTFRPQPTSINVQMRNGDHMVYYTDGSLRHFAGRARRSKQARRHDKVAA